MEHDVDECVELMKARMAGLLEDTDFFVNLTKDLCEEVRYLKRLVTIKDSIIFQLRESLESGSTISIDDINKLTEARATSAARRL
jgi:hypothetical protein